MYIEMGFNLFATKNTAEVMSQGGIENVTVLYKHHVNREPNIRTYMTQGKLDLVINVPDSMDSQALTDGFELRRAAVDSGCPLIVDIKQAILTTVALHRKWSREKSGKPFWSLLSWQEYTEQRDVVAAER